MKNEKSILVSVVMGSQSDWATMKVVCDLLEKLDVSFEKKIIYELTSDDEIRNQILPGALSLLSDVTIGFFFGGTASLESSFKTKSIMIIFSTNNT